MKCKPSYSICSGEHDFIVTTWQTNGDMRHATQFLCRACLCFMSPEDIRELQEEYIKLEGM